jgi:hypothetical protein
MKELKNLSSSNNKKLLVILPLSSLNDVYLNECAYSLAQQTYPIDLLVLSKGLSEDDKKRATEILSLPKIRFVVKNAQGQPEQKEEAANKKLNFAIEETENHTFQSVFNEGFNYAVINGYEWFSAIEHEDVIDIGWFENFVKFSEKKVEYHGFLPLTRQVSNGSFVGFFNEASWSDGLGVEVAGVFDLQLLMRFNCMNATGAIFKTSSVKEYAEEKSGAFKPMKESMKISYMHEFFLRMVYNDLKFYTIPRVGYEHRTDTSSKLVNPFSSKIPRDITSKASEDGGMSGEEFSWWSDLARKEYFFDPDRNVEYVARVK